MAFWSRLLSVFPTRRGHASLMALLDLAMLTAGASAWMKGIDKAKLAKVLLRPKLLGPSLQHNVATGFPQADQAHSLACV